MGNFITISLSLESVPFLCPKRIVQKATHPCKLEENYDSLQAEMEDLIQTKNDILRKVIIAEQEHKQRLNKVQLWLTRVQDIEFKFGALQETEHSQKTEKSCLGGFCSRSCKSRYKLSKNVAKMLQKVRTLKREGDGINEVAEKVPEEPVEERPSETTIVGQQSTFDQVWRCLGEGEGRIIGLYGMGGVGKTTLLTHINNKFLHTPNAFDVVIWVVVSKDFHLEEIQDKIGKRIGLFNEFWKNKTLDEKASDIFKILSKKKFALLLDDIWRRVDLTKIGIPLPSPNLSSKIVFTTRFIEVCGQMEARKKFRVDCLTHKEAWKLFQNKVGEDTLESHPNIRELSEIVTKECDGLPLALITVGRAMSSKKTLEEWNYAIQVLRRSASEFPGMGKEVYPLLKFSYDNLPNDTIRSCLLYCSLFPEDYSIHKMVLIDCWIGEGFLDETEKSEAQNHGYYIIGTLLDACLLEEEEEDQYVKMHDVIRDMTLWIACEIEREKQNFLVHAGTQLTEVPNLAKFEGVRRISLMRNRIDELSGTPFCPHILTLFVNHNHLKIISSDFFQFMPLLRVLNLSHNRFLVELPSGISKLVSLQHIDLSWTAIKELPKELEALENLKCLILENTQNLHMVPRQLISSFSRLSILRMLNYETPTQVAEDSILFGDCESLIEELQCLKYLKVLSITLKTSHTLQRFLSSHKLQNCLQLLCLKYVDDSKSLDILSFTNLMELKVLLILDSKNLEELEINCAMGIRQPPCFRILFEVDISGCLKLRDLTWLVFAPNLKSIVISECSEMKEIISIGKLGEVTKILGNVSPFARLEFFFLRSLQNLKSIYCNPLPFPHLKKISVLHCPKLDKLPFDSHSIKECKFVIEGEEHWWKEIQWEDQATRNAFFPCFESIEL